MGDLINALQKFDPALPVAVLFDSGCAEGYVVDVVKDDEETVYVVEG